MVSLVLLVEDDESEFLELVKDYESVDESVPDFDPELVGIVES